MPRRIPDHSNPAEKVRRASLRVSFLFDWSWKDQCLAFPSPPVCAELRCPISYVFRLYDIVLYSQVEKAEGRGQLSLELEAGGSEAVEAPPEQPVNEHNDRGHDERRSEQDVEAPGVAGAADGAS